MAESDDNEQHLHSNWRALATVHFKHKIFIKSSGTENEQIEESKQEKNSIEIGESVSEFYQEVLQMPATEVKSKPKRKEVRKRKKIEKSAIKKEVLFRLAMNDNADEIEKLIEHSTDVDLNATDNFGWTALMMAACENSIDSFRLLLSYGANINIQDRTGNTAMSLARKKNHQNILNIIEEFNKNNSSSSSSESEMDEVEEHQGIFYCADCKIEIPKRSSKSHQSSTIHLFSCKYNTNATIKSFGIARSNRGYKLMKTLGWDGSSALGPNKNGKLYPIKTVLRKNREGLGVKQNDAKITHFKPHDVRAVHCHTKPRFYSRKEILKQSLKDKTKEQMLRRELS